MLVKMMKMLAFYFLGEVTRSEVEVVYNVCVHNVKRVSLKAKLEMLMKKLAFYFLGEATRSDAEQQKRSRAVERKNHTVVCTICL